MIEWQDDLKVRGSDLFLDARRPRDLSFVSHAHTDHLGHHRMILATAETGHFAGKRSVSASILQAQYGQPLRLSDGLEVTLFPAGHILGSAMVRVVSPEGTLLYTGDFKLRPSLTVPTAQPVPADCLLMECTYGRPQFRFPPWEAVAAELIERCTEALRAGRQPIVYGYALGKAQEICRILTRAGLPVTAHGAVHSLCTLYEALGVPLGPVRPYASDDFHGSNAIDLNERGVLVAPPQAARAGFTTRFDRPLRMMCSGWALQPGAQYRYGVDVALPLSDHADFDELLQLIEQVRPRKIFTHHGFPEFAELLRARGLDARPARPDRQLTLFDD